MIISILIQLLMISVTPVPPPLHLVTLLTVSPIGSHSLALMVVRWLVGNFLPFFLSNLLAVPPQSPSQRMKMVDWNVLFSQLHIFSCFVWS